MEKLVDIFCHAIRITDPLSIKIAVGIVGGGLLLVLITAALIKLGELVARQVKSPCRKRQMKTLCR